MDNIKIYDKRSDVAHLADARVRIVKDSYIQEPGTSQDLVFEKADRKADIPSDALMSWYFAPMDVWFFTTAERCKKMVSNDPAFWTKEKLEDFAKQEKSLYQEWWDGNVYGFVFEKWNAAKRNWDEVKSMYGMYGTEELLDNIYAEVDGIEDGHIPICLDNEEMKYEFDNTEKRPNEFE